MRCGHPAGAAAGTSRGNASPDERPGKANTTTVMARGAGAARAAIAASAYLPRPAAPGDHGSSHLDVAVAVAGAAVVVGVLVAAVVLWDGIRGLDRSRGRGGGRSGGGGRGGRGGGGG